MHAQLGASGGSHIHACVAMQLFATKARLKLNPKRLYAADGTAVREMLKIAQMLNR